jgi:adenosylcobinamide-phosphate synthase
MAVVLAMILDALIGEPKWLWDRAPHPAVVTGRAIAWMDRRFNTGTYAGGILTIALLVIGALCSGALLTLIPGIWAEVIIGAILLAQKSLVQHVQAVANALRLSVSDGRASVAMIVGRDTRGLNGPAVARGAIESAAENLSDGVIAPVFWFVIGGLPGLLVYKTVNTADSMIGYRTPKYLEFGWAAARLDDVLNWVPARLTAVLIWCVAQARAPWSDIRRDAVLHRSPNAGWPEAAIAPALDVSLSGPRSYDGALEHFDWVHVAGRKDANADDIDAAVGVLWRSWALALVAVVVIALL